MQVMNCKSERYNTNAWTNNWKKIAPTGDCRLLSNVNWCNLAYSGDRLLPADTRDLLGKQRAN